MTDGAHPVSNDTELIGIAEVFVNVHRLDCGMGRHGAVGNFMRGKGIV